MPRHHHPLRLVNMLPAVAIICSLSLYTIACVAMNDRADNPDAEGPASATGAETAACDCEKAPALGPAQIVGNYQQALSVFSGKVKPIETEVTEVLEEGVSPDDLRYVVLDITADPWKTQWSAMRGSPELGADTQLHLLVRKKCTPEFAPGSEYILFLRKQLDYRYVQEFSPCDPNYIELDGHRHAAALKVGLDLLQVNPSLGERYFAEPFWSQVKDLAAKPAIDAHGLKMCKTLSPAQHGDLCRRFFSMADTSSLVPPIPHSSGPDDDHHHHHNITAE